MADMASNTITSGPYSRPYINHGSIVVGSPRGSGFLDSNYLLSLEEINRMLKLERA